MNFLMLRYHGLKICFLDQQNLYMTLSRIVMSALLTVLGLLKLSPNVSSSGFSFQESSIRKRCSMPPLLEKTPSLLGVYRGSVSQW